MGRRSMGAKRDLVSMLDVKDDLVGLLELAGNIKNRTKAGEPYEPLRGKSLAMIFEKASTRRRDRRHGHDGGLPEGLRTRRRNPRDGAAPREGQRIEDSHRG